MKKIILLMIMFLCFGCTQKTNQENVNEITKDTTNLAQSMKDFYELETNSYVKGKCFQVKIESISKIKVNEQRYNYIYEIIIAPFKEENLTIHSIQIEYAEEFKEIIQNKKYYNTEFNILNALIADTPLLNDQDDYVAYKLQCVVSSEYYNEYFDVDDYMKKLYMSIDYNQSNETIKLEYLNNIDVIDSLDDIPTERNNIIELYNNPDIFNHSFLPYSK